MRKNKIRLSLFVSVPTITVLGLASCTPSEIDKPVRKKTNDIILNYDYVEAPSAPTYEGNGGEVDVYINYASTSGVSRAEGKGSVSDPITGAQISEKTKLPTWKAFESYTKTNIIDATDYSKSTDALVWTGVTGNNFKSENDSSRNIDLIYNTTSNFGGATDKLTALDDYIAEGKMPNFKAYLDKNPDVKKMLTKSGHIYYTPYFDGQDDIERMFVMDTTITALVLDSEGGWDTTTTNGGSNPSPNVVQGGFYQPFMNPDYNYDSDKTVKILLDNTVKDVTVIKTKNIIKQQNELLAKGCTGQELAQQFISYIKGAYKNLFDEGIYKYPSDVFISNSAAYNADELIALMRVVKANPGMISGKADSEITTFFPRAASNNRIDNIFDFVQIWGVQGVDGENGNFYIGGDGKAHALETTKASYDALDYLSQIYDEGLILKDFYTDANNPNGNATGFLDKFYKKTLNDSSYGFLMYDYSAATCAANDIYAGIGTKAVARKNGFEENYECKGITGILAPLTYWATGNEWSPSQNINDMTGKTLTRYYESNRALKGNSWAIPSVAENKEGAVRLMDVMFSELGQMVNNYGPTEYWAKPDTSKGDTVENNNYDASKAYVSSDLVYGELNPIVCSAAKAQIAATGKDFWSYSREYLGSTHGIGNVRPKGANLQATNAYAQAGVANIQSAFTIGNNDVEGDGAVLKLATISKVKENGETIYTWNTSVPSGFTKTWKDNDNEYSAITGFWAADKLNNNTGWVNAVTRGHNISINTVKVFNSQKIETNYNTVNTQMDVFNKKALYTYSFSINNDNKYVPSYALTA